MPNLCAMSPRTVIMDGGIRLYLRDDRPSKFWQARFRIDGVSEAIVESTKKAKLDEAKAWARDRYFQLNALKQLGQPLRPKPFSMAIDAYLTEQEAEVALLKSTNASNYERKAKALKVKQSVIDLYIRPYFGNKTIEEINSSEIKNYKLWRKTYWINGAGSKKATITYKRNGKLVTAKNTRRPKKTRSGEFGYLRAIFKAAVNNDWIKVSDIPLIEEERQKVDRRPALTSEEYEALYKASHRYMKAAKKHPATYRDRQMLHDYILIMVNSGLRPGREHQFLRWRDVEYLPADENGVINVRLSIDPKTKTGTRKVIAQPRVRTYFERIRKRSPHTKPDDPVFADFKSGKPIASFQRSFNALLKFANMTHDRFGNHYTLYSLRHTYATLRLENGELDVYLLAKNMGTSVQMIEHHYGQDDVSRRIDEITRVKSSVRKSVAEQ